MNTLRNQSSTTDAQAMLESEKMKGGIKNLIIIVLLLAVFITVSESKTTSEKMSQQIVSLEDKNKELVSANKNLSIAFDSQLNELCETLNVVKELDDQNKQLVKEKDEAYQYLDDTKKQLDEATEIINLYDKYSYTLTYGGKRTDITYKQLKLGETLMAEKGLDPNLLFGILMVESNGNSRAKNPCSSSTGYGQFINGTGKFVYEDLMGNGRGTYSQAKAMDGDTNIEMMATYLDYLVEKNNNKLYAAIYNYRGVGGSVLEGYIGKINRFVAPSGTSFQTMAANIKR